MAITLPTSLLCAAQVRIKRAARLLVSPNVATDRLVTDGKRSSRRKPSRDLFRAPALDQRLAYLLQVLNAELLISARTRSSSIAQLLCLGRPVMPVPGRAVAPEFASNGAAMAAQLACDLRGARPLRSERSQHISLLRGDLAIRHGEVPLLGGGEASPVSSDRLARSGGLVAVTL